MTCPVCRGTGLRYTRWQGRYIRDLCLDCVRLSEVEWEARQARKKEMGV